MLILFHCIINCLYGVYNKLFKPKIASDPAMVRLETIRPYAQFDIEKCIQFDPPVYKQRYGRVIEILTSEKWKGQLRKVVDFGCAEFGMFVFLKNSEVPLQEIHLVDIDETLLEDNMYRVYPLSADYLVGRLQPMTVKVYSGSISNPDPSLLNTDIVIALEIIEHLYPDVLDGMPYNFFHYIKPKLAIFTTPNVEFNVLFEKLKTFRHPDHKFEWDRDQFQTWALNIVERFPDYEVQFDGVGLGPPECQQYGSCSQLALFIRKDFCDNTSDSFEDISHGICTCNTLSRSLIPAQISPPDYYRLLKTIEYPWHEDSRTEEERYVEEIRYKMNLYGLPSGRFYRYEVDRSEVPLRLVTCKIPWGNEQVKALLAKFNIKFEECTNQDNQTVETCVIYEPDVMETSGSGSDTEASGYESDKCSKSTKDEANFSDWDAEEHSTSKESEMHLEMNTNRGALYDSGYQKSPTEPPPPPPLPPPLFLDNPNLKNHPNKLSHILSVFDDFDKINELDATRREKKHFNFSTNLPHKEVMKKLCQEIQKHPVAGPSRDPKKKSAKKSSPSDSDDSAEEVKEITTCILENTLNKLEVKDEELQRGDIIQDLIELEEPPEEIEAQPIVENGDLANNNRDLEGNNYAEQQPEVDQVPVDNQEANNVNNNEIIDMEEPPIEVEDVAHVPEEEAAAAAVEPDVEVAWSSREALFDVNSQVDLLEEFDGNGLLVSSIMIPENYVIVPEHGLQQEEGPVLPVENAGFPNWLLQIFEETDAVPDGEEELHDEPHYYCQGDGLGVHPSTAALDDDDDDDDDDGHETDSDSSSSGSASFVNAENTSNSTQDVFVTPEGSREENSLVVTGNAVNGEQEGSETDEVFENAEENESNLFTSPFYGSQ